MESRFLLKQERIAGFSENPCQMKQFSYKKSSVVPYPTELSRCKLLTPLYRHSRITFLLYLSVIAFTATHTLRSFK